MSSRTDDPKATHPPTELEAIASPPAAPLDVEGAREGLVDGGPPDERHAGAGSPAPSDPAGSSARAAQAGGEAVPEGEDAPPSVTSARIHVRRDERLDLVIEYLAFVAKPMPLSLLLDEAPQRIAAILGADVASLYLLEGDGDELVLRGNVGFPREARGTVRLSVGQGITGMAVECLRPISVVQATEHERYRAFPELREERFPVFLAAPILGSGRPLGALVVQRAGDRAFTARDVELLMALTAPIAAGARHAQVLDELRERRRRTGGGTRKVTLPGLPVVPGRALGALAALRRPASSSLGPQRGRGDPKLLRLAFDIAEKALVELHARAAERGIAQDAAFLSTYLLMIGDGRLRARAFELAAGGRTVAQALGTVAREVARAANGIVGDPFLQDRARDIEDLCDAILMLATPDARAELPSKAVLVGDQLTVFDLLISARANPVGVALSERSGPRSHVLLQLLGVPSIVDVAGAFRWASPGDVALLDADHGFLVINPSRAEVATVRAARRKGPPLPGPTPDDDGEDEPAN
ncbi:GAF domain-containing protein [Sorangium sp. So ce834]|uniref:GAF domain-containing protein n=1 Tax=Sorangium sp. So ce834 TaxID=3133321 RepID=UPI003F6341A1